MLNITQIKAEILPTTFIQDIYYSECLESTNEFLKKITDKDNVLVISEYQTEGRGRHRRVWESEPNKNLIFSIKKRLDKNFKNLFTINFYFSYFLLTSVENYLITNNHFFIEDLFEIKWPNDLLYKSKKFSGLLIESNLNKKEYIIGIGLNVNQLKFNKNYHNNTTSLMKITGQKINLNNLFINIIKTLSNNIQLLENNKDNEIYRLWRTKFKLKGKKVKFIKPDEEIQIAQVIDINKDGSIKLEINEKLHNFFAGEVKLLTN